MNAPSQFAVNLPIKAMRDLLLARKATLEAQIAERFRGARADGAPRPDVRTVSAILRSVKDQLAAVGDG